MESYYDEALTLLGVGMVTVFIVLTLVVLVGNLIIFLTNRFLPDTGTATLKDDSGIPPPILDIITNTVKKVAGERAKISNIRKL